MPEDTLYIDADEEITSVIDKVLASEAPTVTLVVPKGTSVFQSLVNLKLLKKKADEAGKRLTFVTGDQVGQNLLAKLGAPVYRDIEGQEEIVQTPKLPEPPEEVIEIDMSEKGKERTKVDVHHYQSDTEDIHLSQKEMKLGKPTSIRRFLIGLMLFLFACGGILLFYPKTTIVLGVKSEPFQSTIELVIDKSITEVNRGSSLLPGTEIVVEKEKAATAFSTGKKTIGEKAKGTVTVYNNCYDTTSSVTIPSGTLLKAASSNLEFTLTAAVTVPAAAVVSGSCSPTTNTVSVEANNVGELSNLAANTDFCVGSYTCSGTSTVTAKNASAFSGGTSREVKILKEEDIKAAGEATKTELIIAARSDVESMAQDRELRVLTSAFQEEVVSITPDKPAGTETNDAQVVTKILVRTLAFAEKDYRGLIVDLLTLRLPEGKKPILSADDEIVTTVSEADWNQGFVKVKGEVKTRTVDEIDEATVKKIVRNTSLGTAKARLLQIPGVVAVSIEAKPRFLNRTAFFARNIIVSEETQ